VCGLSRIVFNGIDAASGAYLYPSTTVEELGHRVLESQFDPDPHLDELAQRTARDARSFGVAYPSSADDLAEAGWAIVTAAEAAADAVAALEPLTSLRHDQTGRLFKVFTGGAGLRPGESKDAWLGRHGMGPGDAEPDKVPYYVLLVGGPEEIPFRFQYELDVHYAVGRLAFGSLDDYARYAHAVVTAEATTRQASSSLALFAPEHPDDPATHLSATALAGPLGDQVRTAAKRGCSLKRALADAATKQQLCEFVSGAQAPDLLFTATHGIGFPAGHDQQREQQGALLCQDWPGPRAWGHRPLEDRFYFTAADVPDHAESLPTIMFAFACFGAGTPVDNDFRQLRPARSRKLAPRPFVARLPQRLLAHPAGQTLAFIGHVDRAWECSFSAPEAGPQRGVFVSTIASILDGRRVGHALEFFNSRYAGIGSSLANLLETYARQRKKPPRDELAEKLIATNDARNYMLLGDPAVRLSTSITPRD